MSKKPVWAVAAVLERAGVPCAREIAWMLRVQHVHAPAEAVVENLVDATAAAEGSYDSVIYCAECGAELSRETVVIPIKPVAYEYNGFRVPNNLVWDTEKYPYNMITHYTTDSYSKEYYRFYCMTTPLKFVRDSTLDDHIAVTGRTTYISTYFYIDGFVENPTYAAENTASVFDCNELVWTNFDVYWIDDRLQTESDELYLAGSEPIPIYE